MQPRLLGKLITPMPIIKRGVTYWQGVLVVHLSDEQLGGCQSPIVLTSFDNIHEIIKQTEANDWHGNSWYVDHYLSTAFKYRFNEAYEVE